MARKLPSTGTRKRSSTQPALGELDALVLQAEAAGIGWTPMGHVDTTGGMLVVSTAAEVHRLDAAIGAGALGPERGLAARWGQGRGLAARGRDRYGRVTIREDADLDKLFGEAW